jgi:hypothetical protein
LGIIVILTNVRLHDHVCVWKCIARVGEEFLCNSLPFVLSEE